MTKVCNVCHETKDISEFHRRKSATDGYRGVCKQCRHERRDEDRSQRHEPGYESLIASVLDATVDDFKKPYRFQYVKRGNPNAVAPDGDEWADYKVTKKEVVHWVCGPTCQWYLSMVLQDVPIQEKQRGLLKRMGIEGTVPDYCEVCDQECDEYDSNGVCIHDLCRVDRDAMRAEALEVR